MKVEKFDFQSMIDPNLSIDDKYPSLILGFNLTHNDANE